MTVFKVIGFVLVGLSSLLWMPRADAKTVRYELTISSQKVNLSGKKAVDFALTVNGGIPAPTLEFTEGDDAEIVVKNRIPNQETSVHWHGILLPSEMDGVPYVNMPPIQSGAEFVYRFKIRQHGTYWYHSHTMTQEQEGVYGAFIIHPKKKTIAYDKEVVVVLSDWADESGSKISDHLRKDGDYYLYKKGTLRSWMGAIQAGKLGIYLGNEWTRMGGMDFSDVGYDAFLMNGKKDQQLVSANAGERVRLRIINASASTYFSVSLGQAPMQVVSADGMDVTPLFAKEILMGMAETYDVIFQVPENKNYELRATSQDGTGFASGWIGQGPKVFAPVKPFPDLYMAMDHTAHGSGSAASHGEVHASDHAHHLTHETQIAPTASGHLIETLTVDELKAQKATAFASNAKTHDVKLVLGGDMRRYIWHINNKAIHQDRTILIQSGDVIRFTFENTTMMHHPMHLHGHFFRVLNKNKDWSPLKHTVDVPPHQSRTIEFLADEPGEWMLHCHNLFHMGTGMARVVKYSDFIAKPEIAHLQHQDHHLHDPWYFYGSTEVGTNHSQARFRLSQTWNEIDARLETRNTDGKNLSFKEPWEVEGDVLYHRWFGQYFHLIAGGLVFDKKFSGAGGVGYLLPLLIESHLLLDHRRHLRLDLEKRFQWTKVFFTDVDVTWRPHQGNELGHDFEYELSFMVGPSWSWAAGLMLTDRNLGAGMQFQF